MMGCCWPLHFPEDRVVVLDTWRLGRAESRTSVDGARRYADLRSGWQACSPRWTSREGSSLRSARGRCAYSDPRSTWIDRRDVVSVAFSPDGKRLATCSLGESGGPQPLCRLGRAVGPPPRHVARRRSQDRRDHLCPRWPFADRRRRPIAADLALRPAPRAPSPAGHKDEAWAVAYSPDGKILATGSDDTDERQTIKLWDPATGRLIRGWNGGVGTVASLAFSPDGRILASGHLTDRDNVRLWDVSTGSLLHTLRGHKSMVRSVAFSPDGRTLATAGGRKGEGGRGPDNPLVGRRRGALRPRAQRATPTSCARSRSRPTAELSPRRATTRRSALGYRDGAPARGSADSPDKLVALAFAPDGATLAVADATRAWSRSTTRPAWPF